MKNPEKLETFAEAAQWMYDYAHLCASRIVAIDQQVHPVIMVLATDGSMDIMVCSMLSKDQTARLLNALAGDAEVRCVVFMSEAWHATAKADSAESKELQKRDTLEGFEGVEDGVLMHFRGSGEERWVMCPIEVKDGKKTVARPPLENPAGQMVSGRFMAPTPPPNKLH